MKMKEEVTIVKLDDIGFGVVVTSLSDKRNSLIRDNKSTEIVDEVLIKLSQSKRKKERSNDEAR